MAIKSCSFLAAIFTFVLARNEKIMGPFDPVISHFDNCEDIGTGDVSLSVKLNRLSPSLTTADFNFTLKESFADDLAVHFSVDRLVHGVYSQNYIKQVFKNLCSTSLHLAPKFMKDIFSAFKVRHSCPIKKGFYIVKNFTTLETVPSIPTFFYCKARLTFSYHKHGRLIGCYYAYLEIVPKSKRY